MKAVLRQTGLNADNLRAWEKRYGAVKPKRGPSGRRVYSESEVQRLSLLVRLVRLGHAISKVAPLSDNDLIQLINKSQDRIDSQTQIQSQSNLGLEKDRELDRLFSSMMEFNLQHARSALNRLRFQVSPRVFAFDLIPQIMFWVGQRIQDGKLSISQEHALSEMIRSHIFQIYDGLSSEEGTLTPTRSLVFCTREGDPHDFALLMSAIACRYRGFKTHYLGKGMPAESLMDAVIKIRPEAIVLGVSDLPQDDEKVNINTYLHKIDRHISKRVGLWMGGSGLKNFKRTSIKRDYFIFESISDLENKLSPL